MGGRHQHFEDPITWSRDITKTKFDLLGLFVEHPLSLVCLLNFADLLYLNRLQFTHSKQNITAKVDSTIFHLTISGAKELTHQDLTFSAYSNCQAISGFCRLVKDLVVS